MSVLVTGASGFVGRALVQTLESAGFRTKGVYHNTVPDGFVSREKNIFVGDISADTDWSEYMRDVEIVIHLAARVHITKEWEKDPLSAFRAINTEGTVRLARQAAENGVRRMIYLSSIKVNGELTNGRGPFSESDIPAPKDPYAISKWNAEQSLYRISQETDLETVVVRPPLIYGPGVKANFLSMMKWLYKGVPLPLGSIHNRRSLLALDNLIDLIMLCMKHPAAKNQTFLATDGEDLSTTDLLNQLGFQLGRPARLIPVPVCLLWAGTMMLGRKAICQRLCGSLQASAHKAYTMLGWRPPVSVTEGLARTAQKYLLSLK